MTLTTQCEEHKLIFCGSGNYFNNETTAKMFRCEKCDREFFERS